MLRQMADIAVCPTPLRQAGRRRIAGRGLCFHSRSSALKVFEGQLAFVRRQLFRPLAMHYMLQLAHGLSRRRACRLVGVDPKTVPREPEPDNPERGQSASYIKTHRSPDRAERERMAEAAQGDRQRDFA